MKYFFVLGNNTALSAAEISSYFNKAGNKIELINSDVLILDAAEEIDAKELIKKIGGTIKIGKITGETDSFNPDLLPGLIQKNISAKEAKGKFNFGISFYGKRKINLKILGMTLKRNWQEEGISVRWVTSREPVLSSVVVRQNKLVDSGAEIILIEHNKNLLLGKTLSVQPFKELSYRDYGRPARDDLSGMLPPKLAQIMINLGMCNEISSAKNTGLPSAASHAGTARNDKIILDPFCGSGTILTEAALMGYGHLVGSDISAKAMEDTKRNIEWIVKNYELKTLPTGRQVTNYELINKKAEEISRYIGSNSIDAVVTEPYLGPQRGKFDFKKVKTELENLYSKSLAEFYKVLKPGGRVVMVWPVFNLMNHELRIMNQEFLNIKTEKFKIINPVPEILRENKFIKLTNRNTIVYGRQGQKVWREIVVLEK